MVAPLAFMLLASMGVYSINDRLTNGWWLAAAAMLVLSPLIAWRWRKRTHPSAPLACANFPGLSANLRQIRLARWLGSTFQIKLVQQPKPIADHQQAGPHVGKHRHPHGASTSQRQHQKYGLDAQGQHNVLYQHGMGAA